MSKIFDAVIALGIAAVCVSLAYACIVTGA